MIKNPKVSVIFVFYNCEKFLDDSIKSILNQTYKDFELIIIDDASTDNSKIIVNKYLNDKRIKYIRNKKNVGKAKNCNLGIDKSKGEYIALMDGDDISLLDRIEKQMDFLLKNPKIDVVGCQQTLIDSENNVIGELLKPVDSEDIKKSVFLFQTMNHPTILAKASVFKELRYNDDIGIFDEDNDLIIRMTLAGYNLYNLKEKLYLHRIYGGNVGKKTRWNRAINIYKFKRRAIKRYNYKLSLKERFYLYTYLITGTILSKNMQRNLHKFVKNIFYGNKLKKDTI